MKFNKKLIFIAVAILIAGFTIYYIQKPKGPTYKTAKAVRGSITQEISETGTIKKGDVINLNFKNSGTIAKVNVTTGDKVSAGQVLAEQDTSQLKIQLAQAQANLELYQSQLAKLLNGASAQDITISRTNEENYRIALENARQSLDDAQESARQKLANYYAAASDALDSAYAKAYNARNFANLLQRTYFAPQDDDSISVWETTQKIDLAVGRIKGYIDAGQASGKEVDIDRALAQVQVELAAIAGWLGDIRAICEKTAWRDTVTAADKSSSDTHRDYVIAAQTSVNTSQQNIELQKAANETAVNTAKAALAAAEGSWKTAQDQLAKTTGAPRAEDINALNAQIAAALAQADLLKLQISDSQLKAPVSGQVIEVNARLGETSQPLLATAGTVVILPDNPYEVEVDIYEEDVAKEKIGNKVLITPVPFPDINYTGKVVSIDPAGKMVNGVIYYANKISFDEAPVGLKPDMSADIVITTAHREDALLVPEGALRKKDSQHYVQILQDGKPLDVPVQTGIRASGQVEIISGLNEGEEVIIP